MQLGLLGLIAERGGFADIAGLAEAFEYWSISQGGGQFGFIATPVDPAGKRDRIPAADFTSVASEHFTEAARDWWTGDWNNDGKGKARTEGVSNRCLRIIKKK